MSKLLPLPNRNLVILPNYITIAVRSFVQRRQAGNGLAQKEDWRGMSESVLKVVKSGEVQDNSAGKLSGAQKKWLVRGLDQAGGKLPLFDNNGQKVSSRTVESCIKSGWAEPWFENPIKPDWLVCKLTDAGRKALDS